MWIHRKKQVKRMDSGKNVSRIDKELFYSRDLDRRQIKTKKAIISAFLRLMETKDISHITITELANEANIDRKTFYLHYKSIQAVYDDISQTIVVVIRQLIEEYMNSDAKFEPYQLFRKVNAVIEDDLPFYRDAVASGSFSDVIEKIGEAFCAALEKAYADDGGSVSDGLRLFLVFVSRGTVSMYIAWLEGSTALTADELAHLAADAIIHGVMGIADKVL